MSEFKKSWNKNNKRNPLTGEYVEKKPTKLMRDRAEADSLISYKDVQEDKTTLFRAGFSLGDAAVLVRDLWRKKFPGLDVQTDLQAMMNRNKKK